MSSISRSARSSVSLCVLLLSAAGLSACGQDANATSAVATASAPSATAAPAAAPAPAVGDRDAATNTGPKGVVVSAETVMGTGCPAGTSSSSWQPGKRLVISTTQFVAKAGGSSGTSDRKACQASLRIAHPAGWSYALSRLTLEGSASLPVRGGKADFIGSHYIQGHETSAADTGRKTVNGVYKKSVTATVTTPDSKLTWSSCDDERLHQVKGDLRVDPAGRSAHSARVDRIVVDVAALRWKRC